MLYSKNKIKIMNSQTNNNAASNKTIILNTKQSSINIPSTDEIGNMINQICEVLCYANCDPMKLSLKERIIWYLELSKDYMARYGKPFQYIEKDNGPKRTLMVQNLLNTDGVDYSHTPSPPPPYEL